MIQDFEPLLDDFDYMPGWLFTTFKHTEGDLMVIEFTVVDANNPDEMQTQRVETFIPPCRTPRDFYDWLYWRLKRIAIHEVGEFFKIRGERFADPHQPMFQENRLVL